ncbi:hypothetical protein VKT23_003788 [Stygiomarasmius scandens]|uniref:DNA mismatch repair protein MutS core domain-containing protein n=1 Tax=Marasmiellus scandens TaxID=2682957 RepID=A0ABR1JYB9_9AGAR
MTRDLKQLSNRRRHQSRKRKQISKTVSGDNLMSDSPVEDDLGETPPSRHKKVRWDSHATSETHDNLEMESETSQSVVVEKIALTAWCQNNRVGVAYYDPSKCIIYIVEDTEETSHFDLTRMILEQASPDIVLTSSRSDDAFKDTVSEFMDASCGIFQIRPYKEFSAAKGRDRLLSLQLLSELPSQHAENAGSSDGESSEDPSRNAYDFMKRQRESVGDPAMKRWNASIRLYNFASTESSSLCMASVGALIDHLIRERALDHMEDEGIHSLEVRDIESLALNEIMQINMDALLWVFILDFIFCALQATSSLQIFENESHASIHSDKTKEGLSLAGVLDNTHTSLGRALMRVWLLRPSLSLNTIRARHDAIDCFLKAENHSATNALHSHLKGIKNVPRMLNILKTGRAKVSDWQGLVKIDWEESAEAGRLCVRPHIDEELDKRKHIYHGIDSVLLARLKVKKGCSQKLPKGYPFLRNVPPH